MPTRDTGVVALWIASAIVSTSLTIRWFRRHRHTDVRSSIVCTTIAGVPGVLLVLEVIAGYLQGGAAAYRESFDALPVLLSCLWVVAGPALLLIGLLLRLKCRETPRGTALVQLSHAVMWGWSTVLVFFFAAAI